MLYRHRASQFPGAALRLSMVIGLALLIQGCKWSGVATVSTTGGSPNSDTFESEISTDGRYVGFVTQASNLVPGDTNETYDIFLRDTLQGAATRISLKMNGQQSSGGFDGPRNLSLSGDGRYIVFDSDAGDLVSNDGNNDTDAFMRDLVTGTNLSLSHNSAGDRLFAPSGDPVISEDGHYIAFGALTLPYTDNWPGIYLYHRDTGSLTLVSVDSAGNEGNFGAGGAAISDDGRYISFTSRSYNLVAGDTNNRIDVFVHDRVTGTTTRVSVDSAGGQSNDIYPDGSSYADISGDGRYVTFLSDASNLVPGDTNGKQDVFLHNLVTGITSLVSADSAGNPGNGWSFRPKISGDGRYVAFESESDNLVADDTNGASDIFVRDTLQGTTIRVSEDAADGQLDRPSRNPEISHDGRYVTFSTGATNLVPASSTGWHYNNIVIKAITEVSVTSVIPNHLPIGATTPITIAGTNFLAGAIPLVGGAQVANSVIVDENTITADVTVPADAPSGAQDVSVAVPGTGPGQLAGVAETCADCVTLSPAPVGC